MLTRKDINEFKSIGYYAIAMIITSGEPSTAGAIALFVFWAIGTFYAFRKD
jgi:hypothetical protein